jgi:hypothetical protein
MERRGGCEKNGCLGDGGGDQRRRRDDSGTAKPLRWMPVASDLKPALDAVRSQTGLIPDLNAIIAAFADLPRPRWRLNCIACELDLPLGELPRRFGIRLLLRHFQLIHLWLPFSSIGLFLCLRGADCRSGHRRPDGEETAFPFALSPFWTFRSHPPARSPVC